MRNILAKYTFWTAVIFGLLNLLAIKFYLFWTVSFYDNVMHFLGGFLVYLIFVFILSLFNRETFMVPNIFWSFVFVFTVGTIWECFELAYSLTDIYEAGYFKDTIMDYIMDLLGGLLGFLFLSFRFKLKN